MTQTHTGIDTHTDTRSHGIDRHIHTDTHTHGIDTHTDTHADTPNLAGSMASEMYGRTRPFEMLYLNSPIT